MVLFDSVFDELGVLKICIVAFSEQIDRNSDSRSKDKLIILAGVDPLLNYDIYYS